jgi:hypothetical protein
VASAASSVAKSLRLMLRTAPCTVGHGKLTSVPLVLEILRSEAALLDDVVMELLDGKVARETQYFGDPFGSRHSRAQRVERVG